MLHTVLGHGCCAEYVALYQNASSTPPSLGTHGVLFDSYIEGDAPACLEVCKTVGCTHFTHSGGGDATTSWCTALRLSGGGCVERQSRPDDCFGRGDRMRTYVPLEVVEGGFEPCPSLYPCMEAAYERGIGYQRDRTDGCGCQSDGEHAWFGADACEGNYTLPERSSSTAPA